MTTTQQKPTLADFPPDMVRTDNDERLWAKLSDWERERTLENAQYAIDSYGPGLTLTDINCILAGGG